MNLALLFIHELLHRRGAAVAVILVVAISASVQLLATGFLARHDRETSTLLAEINQRTSDRLAKMLDDTREFTKSLGYNLVILPARQSPESLYASNQSTEFFDESVNAAFSTTRPQYVNHVLPFLRTSLDVPELGGKIRVLGIEGQVFRQSPNQTPITQTLADGEVRIGYDLAGKLGISGPGEIRLWGESHRVVEVLPQTGNLDDVTLVLPLKEAQTRAGLPGRLGGFYALSCNCEAGNTAIIAKDLARILPDPQVIEFMTSARARSEARKSAATAAETERLAVRTDREKLKAGLVRASEAIRWVTFAAAGGIVFFLFWIQAATRRGELALFRALGWGGGRIFLLTAGRILVLIALGLLVGLGAILITLRSLQLPGPTAADCLGAAALAAACAFLASCPGLWKVWRQDPAEALREER